MNMLSLSLCFALMMLSCCENQEEATTSDYEYVTETVTPDYDYNATFEYYYVTELFHSEGPDLHLDEVWTMNKSAGIGPFSLLFLLGLAVHQLWT